MIVGKFSVVLFMWFIRFVNVIDVMIRIVLIIWCFENLVVRIVLRMVVGIVLWLVMIECINVSNVLWWVLLDGSLV